MKRNSRKKIYAFLYTKSKHETANFFIDRLRVPLYVFFSQVTMVQQ